MASETKCPCTHSDGGNCVCEVTAPCAKDSENRTMQWTANCGCEGGDCCSAKFTIKCSCETAECGTSCCSQEDKDKEVTTFNVKCGDKNCELKVRKCKCCTVTLEGAEGGAGGCCGAKSEGCCKE